MIDDVVVDDGIENDEMYDDEYTFTPTYQCFSIPDDVGINHVVDGQRFDSSLKDGYFYICSEQNSAPDPFGDASSWGSNCPSIRLR